MKNIQRGALALLVATFMSVTSCGPTDNKGGMDEKNSSGEGAIDSTKLTNIDSTSTGAGVDTSTMK